MFLFSSIISLHLIQYFIHVLNVTWNSKFKKFPNIIFHSYYTSCAYKNLCYRRNYIAKRLMLTFNCKNSFDFCLQKQLISLFCCNLLTSSLGVPKLTLTNFLQPNHTLFFLSSWLRWEPNFCEPGIFVKIYNKLTLLLILTMSWTCPNKQYFTQLIISHYPTE